MNLELNYSQRQLIYKEFRELLEGQIITGKLKFSAVFGTTTQAVLREAVYYIAFYRDIIAKVEEETYGENINEKGEKEPLVRVWYKMSMTLYIPGLDQKMILEKKILKSKLENV